MATFKNIKTKSLLLSLTTGVLLITPPGAALNISQEGGNLNNQKIIKDYNITKIDKLFLKNKNYIFVVGAKAKPIDVVAAIDIASALVSYSSKPEISKVKIGVETENEEVKGLKKLWRDNDKINIGEGLKITVIDINKKEKLEGGSKDYYYNTYIKLNENTNAFNYTFKKPSGDKDPELLGDISSSSKDDFVAKLVIDFDDAVDFTDDEGNVNEDLIGKKIKVGKNLFFISSETKDDKLVLYRTSKKVLIEKNKPITVKVDGKEYTIKIVGFGQEDGNDKVILDVNGDIDSIIEENTKTIGGLTIYADSIWTEDNNKDGGAVLLVGGKKLILENDSKVKVGDSEDSVDGTYVKIVKSSSGNNLKSVKEIDVIYYEPDSDHNYIDEENSFNVDKDVFDVFKIIYEKPDIKTSKFVVDRSDTRLEFKGKEFARIENSVLKNENDDGGKTKLYEGEPATENDWIFVGTYNTKEIVDETTTALLKVDDITIDGEDGQVKFEDVFTNEDYETNKGKFNETGDTLTLNLKGETYVVKLLDPNEKIISVYHEGWNTTDDDGDLDKTIIFPVIKVGGVEVSFIPKAFYNASSGKLEIKVNTSVLDNNFEFTTDNYLLGSLMNVTTNTITIDINGKLGNENKNVSIVLLRDKRLEGEDERFRPVDMVIYYKDSNNEFRYLDTLQLHNSVEKIDFEDLESDNDIKEGYDKYGTKFRINTDSDNQDMEIYVPEEQIYGKFYVDLGDKENNEENYKVIEVGKNPVEIDEKVKSIKLLGEEEKTKGPIYLPIGFLDKEIEEKNLNLNGKLIISVGGPCVNEVTKEFLAGTPYGSCKSWPLKEGQALIKYVEKGGIAALIIAGTKGEDTRNAAKEFIVSLTQ